MTSQSSLTLVFFIAIFGANVKAVPFEVESAMINIAFILQDAVSSVYGSVPVTNKNLANAAQSSNTAAFKLISNIYLRPPIDVETASTDPNFGALLNDLYALYSAMNVFAQYFPQSTVLPIATTNLLDAINLFAKLQVPFLEYPSSFNPTSVDEAYIATMVLIARAYKTLYLIEPLISDFHDTVVALSLAIRYATDGFPHETTTQDGAPLVIENTFVLVKSDGVARGLTGDIVKRLQSNGFQMLGMKFVWAPQQLLDLYMDNSNPYPFHPDLALMLPGPVVAMVWQGLGAVDAVTAMIGGSDPDNAVAGTIRGDYGISAEKTIVYSSSALGTVKFEIKLWFTESELVAWTPETYL